MRPARLSTRGVVDTALDLIDHDGYDALSVSAVAGRLGVGPSALYAHCDSLDGLRNLVAIAATHNLTADVRTAAVGTSGPQALAAMGSAYRRFVHEHPGQFAATLRPPPLDNGELASANDSLLDVFALVYLAMGLERGSSELAAHSTRCAIHGFLALEHVMGTDPAHSAAYEHLLDTLQRGLAD